MNAYDLWNHIPRKQRYFKLSEKEWLIFETAIQNIETEGRRVEGQSGLNNISGTLRKSLLAFNESGLRPPIYWCFNSWAEPLMFSRHLQHDQPFFAMHSPNRFVKTWHEKTRFHEHLSLHYFEQIALHNHNCRPVLVGNCQGAPVAESIAILFSQKLALEPLLVTLDYIPRRQYRGPILMLFGRNSDFNPFVNSDKDPVPLWKSKFDAFAWGFVDAEHGEYFRSPAIEQLHAYIEKASDFSFAKKNFSGSELQLAADKNNRIEIWRAIVRNTLVKVKNTISRFCQRSFKPCHQTHRSDTAKL